MARVALTLAGQVGGYALGGPLGAFIGGAVGSLGGALLFPGGEDRQGPRLGDLRVGDASFGVPIPQVWGTARIAGTLIWTSGIEEHRQEESQGASGGGPTYTTFTYSASFAVALCVGPIEAVRKLWLDSKLVYDVSSDNLGVATTLLGEVDPRQILSESERQARLAELLQQVTEATSRLRFYLGAETQLPSALQEAVEGLGEVPAYRGLAYVEFEDLPLANYGNRIPNITAEVTTAKAEAYPKTTAPTPGTTIHKDHMLYDAARRHHWSLCNQQLIQINGVAHTVLRREILNTVPATGSPQTASVLHHAFDIDRDGYLYVLISPTLITNNIARLDPVSWQATHVGLTASLTPASLLPIAFLRVGVTHIWATTYAFGSRLYAFLRPGSFDPRSQSIVTAMRMTANVNLPLNLRGEMIAVDRDGAAWVACSGVRAGTKGILVRATPDGDLQSWDLSADLEALTYLAYDALTHALILRGLKPGTLGTGRIVRWDIASESIEAISADNAMPGIYIFSAWKHGIVNRHIWVTSNLQWAAFNVDTLTVTQTKPGGFPPALMWGGLYDPETTALWAAETGGYFAKYYLNRLAVNTVPVADVITDVATQAGLDTTTQLNLAAVSSQVRGYARSQRTPGRETLAPLLDAFLLDAGESDWKLRVVPRGTVAPVAALTQADLGARSPETPAEAPLVRVRQSPHELPVRLDLSYPDPAHDYQPQVQHARLPQADQVARGQQSVSTPVVLSASEAKRLAERLLAEAWVGRTEYSASVSVTHVRLDAGDVVTITLDDGSEQMVLLREVQHGANGVITLRGIGYDPDSYVVSQSPGAEAETETTTLLPLALTKLFLLDIAMLRDVDDDAGFYLAAAPDGVGTWPGAVVLKTPDTLTYSELTTATVAVDWGGALTRLGDGSPYVFDRRNTLDVRLARGTLASVTELEVLNGANALLVGSEIIQYATATQLSADTWRLSILLRGRRGTEWACTSHGYGEQVIPLRASTVQRVEMGDSELDLVRHYLAVTFGTAREHAPLTPFANSGVGLNPYAPAHIRGTRDGSENLTITWRRRTRVGGEWRDRVEVPLGEVSESYSLDIYDGPDIVRTLTATTTSVVYSAAQQTDDFGAPQGAITVRVYQLSAVVGRGYGTTATV